MSYQIITDSCCDYPKALLDTLNITVVPLTLTFRDQVWTDTTDEGLKTLFNGLRNGEPATTSAANPEDWTRAIEPVLQAGKDALVLTFSSGLSTTYQSAVIAANDLQEAYPQQKIRVVDTLCASLGQGLLVWYACQKQEEGLSLDQLADWCAENRYRLCHWFTVDDLMYLKRGGRISATTALLGTMLNIKPVLHMDDEGHLVNVAKVRSRKASIEALAAKVGSLGLPGANDTIFICHGDCIEDAEYLKSRLEALYGTKNVVIGYVGAVIGSHSGPGTLAIFFMGEHR